jgi:hypothetical protein
MRKVTFAGAGWLVVLIEWPYMHAAGAWQSLLRRNASVVSSQQQFWTATACRVITRSFARQI